MQCWQSGTSEQEDLTWCRVTWLCTSLYLLIVVSRAWRKLNTENLAWPSAVMGPWKKLEAPRARPELHTIIECLVTWHTVLSEKRRQLSLHRSMRSGRRYFETGNFLIFWRSANLRRLLCQASSKVSTRSERSPVSQNQKKPWIAPRDILRAQCNQDDCSDEAALLGSHTWWKIFAKVRLVPASSHIFTSSVSVNHERNMQRTAPQPPHLNPFPSSASGRFNKWPNFFSNNRIVSSYPKDFEQVRYTLPSQE